ncbi:response regulator [Chloroflexota bacterium]
MTNKRILVVDDEPLVVKAIQFSLEYGGYEVITAFSGNQAISKARSEKPDLVLLDIRMPVESGIGVFEILRSISNTSLIPVIFITASANEEVKKKVLEMGAQDFIYKPFNKNDLLAKVKNALGES